MILAYDFPPYVSVGGLRPYNWYKYLHEFDVYPVVVTRQWSGEYGNHLDYIAPSDSFEIIIEDSSKGTIIRTPFQPNFANRLMLKYGDSRYKFLRKTVSAYYEFAQFLLSASPKSSIYFAAEEYLKNNKVDAIIATGSPFVLFKFASKLSKSHNIPWIADYRDPWTQNITIQQNFLFKVWQSYFEKKFVKTASLITTVSEFCEITISSLIKNKEFLILPNGYDPHAIENIRGIDQQKEELSIAFVGTMYDWHPIKSFLSVISQFIEDTKGAKLNISFYGINIASELTEMVSSDFPNLKNHIFIYPKSPNNLLIKELAKANVMLLFNDYSITGTKIYDYIGIKRSILFCYADDTEANKLKAEHYLIEETNETSKSLQEDLIKETNAGYIIRDTEHLKTVISQLYDEFIKNGSIQCNTTNEEKYSRKIQVKKLSEIIKRISPQENAKKILILSYYFPPSNFAGSYRIVSWAKYLYQFGYYPVIITRCWNPNQTEITDEVINNTFSFEKHEHYEVYNIPYSRNLRDRIHTTNTNIFGKWISKFLSFNELILQNYFNSAIPYSNLYKFADKLLSQNKDFSALIVSGRPFQLFRFGWLLNKKYGIKWFADYRDEWTTCQWVKGYNIVQKTLNELETISEKKWLSNATGFISCSDYWVQSIGSLNAKKGYNILNGYDPVDYESELKVAENKHSFVIVYNGTLYSTQPIEIFMEAFKQIIDTFKDKITLKMKFPGLMADSVQAERVKIAIKGYEDSFEILERVSKEEVIEMQKSADILFMSGHHNIKGNFSSKIFEYLGCKRPIFLCPTDNDVMDRLIKTTNTGIVCSSINEAYAELSKLIIEKQNTGLLSYEPNNLEIEKYTRNLQTKYLANILDQIC